MRCSQFLVAVALCCLVQVQGKPVMTIPEFLERNDKVLMSRMGADDENVYIAIERAVNNLLRSASEVKTPDDDKTRLLILKTSQSEEATTDAPAFADDDDAQLMVEIYNATPRSEVATTKAPEFNYDDFMQSLQKGEELGTKVATNAPFKALADEDERRPRSEAATTEASNVNKDDVYTSKLILGIARDNELGDEVSSTASSDDPIFKPQFVIGQDN
ncbi:unnamed protein product, partial [Iphiclides podalirius]